MEEILTEKKKAETIYPQMNAKNANVKNILVFICVHLRIIIFILLFLLFLCKKIPDHC